MESLEEEAGIYGATLSIFAQRNKLPRNLFKNPDHLVLQAADIDDFGQLVREEVAPRARHMACAETDWRFTAAARLRSQIAVYDMGYVNWVAVEEPKRADSEAAGLRRVTFYHEGIRGAGLVLGKLGLHPKIVPEADHQYLDVPFEPEQGLAFRLSNKSLAQVIDEQLDTGEAVPVTLKHVAAAE